MSMKEPELLEYLHQQVGGMYLSDLRQPGNLPLVRRAVRNAVPGRFSLREWNDAVEYITGCSLIFTDAAQAALFIAGFEGGDGVQGCGKTAE